ncbi:MAG: NUDIX hydrolase [Acidobacteriota bacterium]
MARPQTPPVTVDIVIQMNGDPSRIVMIQRRHPPEGWALPGGFVDLNETVEQAAVREAFEETGLKVRLLRQFHVYSAPDRDPRGQTVGVVFIASAEGEPIGQDDAAAAAVFDRNSLPTPIAFDHAQILDDYFQARY